MAAWHEGPLVGLDFETTGVDPLSDLPVQVAVVWHGADGPLRHAVFLVDPGREIPGEAVAIHGITTERARREGCSLQETAERVHRELSVACSEAVPVVAMNASFDVTIAACLFRHAGLRPLEWPRLIDPLVIDRHVDRYRKGKRRLENLCRHYCVSLERPHDAGTDANAAVGLARQIGRRWPEAGSLEAEELTRRQADWHVSWASDFHAWCLREGRRGLDAAEYGWPERLAAAQEASESSTVSTSPSLERGLTMAMRTAALPR